MTMPVTDDQVATLRAQLAGQPAEHKRLLAALDPSALWSGYRALVPAAFWLAVERRFPRGGSVPQVIELVAKIRSISEGIADKIDPRIAERLILRVFGHQAIDDIAPLTRFQHQDRILAALMTDHPLDDVGLDKFLAQARELADRWLA